MNNNAPLKYLENHMISRMYGNNMRNYIKFKNSRYYTELRWININTVCLFQTPFVTFNYDNLSNNHIGSTFKYELNDTSLYELNKSIHVIKKQYLIYQINLLK